MHRDLADPSLWEASQQRSAARRHAASTPAPGRWASRRVAGAATLVAVGAAPATMLATAGSGSTALAAPKAAAASSPTLKRGAHGAAVKRLQRLLHVHADGKFGSGTLRALKRFQRRHHMRVDGVAGPATWRVLRRAHSRALHRSGSGGKTRSAVKRVQHRLGIAADGVFGPQTARAVKRFQRRHGLTADGVVGPATYRAMGIRRGPTLKRGAGKHRGSRGGGGRVILMIRAANRIAGKPYTYGGGHGRWTDSGYDCSGAVSYVLHAAGLLSASRTANNFVGYGVPGRGKHVTIYAKYSHVYMVIDGRRFDSNNYGDGPDWKSPRDSSGFVARHPAGL